MRAPNSFISRAIARLLARVSLPYQTPGPPLDTIAVVQPAMSIWSREICGVHVNSLDPPDSMI